MNSAYRDPIKLKAQYPLLYSDPAIVAAVDKVCDLYHNHYVGLYDIAETAIAEYRKARPWPPLGRRYRYTGLHLDELSGHDDMALVPNNHNRSRLT